MNKAELCDNVHKALGDGATKAEAEKVVKIVLDEIADGVRKDESVQLVGFGTFKVSHRKARKGHNPKTKAPLDIPASKSVKFRPSAKLKASLSEAGDGAGAQREAPAGVAHVAGSPVGSPAFGES